MVNFESKLNYNIHDLEKLVAVLRGPRGCPWDAEQTHESLRRAMLEEAYEVVEAIDEQSTEHLLEELGDVLIQVVFHAGLEQDAGRFSLDDVADGICKKMIFRHPHVFGDTRVSGSAEVLKNWEDIKRVEKSQATHTDALKAVANSLPSLWRAEKLQKKAAKAGCENEDVWDAMDELADSMITMSEALSDTNDPADALGDALFSLVHVARLAGVDPEEALTRSSNRFLRRFEEAEQELRGRGQETFGPDDIAGLYPRRDEAADEGGMEL